MEYENLLDIVKSGEGYTAEFKRSLNDSIGKEICALANAIGGKIILGIDDKTNAVLGCKLSNSDRSKIQDIARNMNPPLNIVLEQIKDLVVIYVPDGKDKPYTVNGHFYLRYGANSQQLNRNEIRDLFQRENMISFERQVTQFRKQDFSTPAFNTFKKEAKLDANLSEKHIYENLNYYTDGRMNNCGILLFTKDVKHYFYNAVISCFLYADTERTMIIDSKEFSEDFFSNLNNAHKYILSKLNTALIISGELKHRKKLELPAEALREAIINAMIHRDYFYPSAIMIHINHEKVEITNPGRLMFPRDQLGKRAVHRNPILVDTAHRVGLIEKAGSGINRIEKMIDDNKSDVIFETGEFFSTIFLRKKMDKQTVHDTVYETGTNEEEIQKKYGRNTEEIRKKYGNIAVDIINKFLEMPEITGKQVAKLLSLSQSTVEKKISILKKDGLLKRHGSTKVGHWEVIVPNENIKKLK
ncbi:MAG: putative DNA binding domain-containing protein [Candidatus Delongbacteria bacterium]|nr:putative DNA binding domain-containing protein [Candidatus Delongbacteria bacterium]MCG2760206.1 putative DNA binding domain-containing protein [Candidatus Delongbacteria bacterium]